MLFVSYGFHLKITCIIFVPTTNAFSEGLRDSVSLATAVFVLLLLYWYAWYLVCSIAALLGRPLADPSACFSSNWQGMLCGKTIKCTYDMIHGAMEWHSFFRPSMTAQGTTRLLPSQLAKRTIHSSCTMQLPFCVLLILETNNARALGPLRFPQAVIPGGLMNTSLSLVRVDEWCRTAL